MPINVFKATLWGLFALLVVTTVLGGFYTVQGYERAVITRFGAVTGTVGEGLHFKMPFADQVHKIYTGISVDQPKVAANTYTIDNQEVDIIFTMFYRVPPDKVEYLYRNVPDYKARMMDIAVDRLKAEMGKVNVTHVAEKRGELRDRIKATLVEDAAEIGLLVTDFQLTNMDYSKAFRAAVEAAAAAKAMVETRNQELEQARKVADTAKVAAIGTADAIKAKADGDAYALLANAKAQAAAIETRMRAEAVGIEAKGRAEAIGIDLQTKALSQNSQLVELEKAKRWSGNLPATMLSNVMPFLNVDQALATRAAQR